jgi:hypothetical protein
MAEQPEILKAGDEVFIESHGMTGKVVQVRPDGKEEPFYRVQIEHNFRRTDLEYINREEDARKRREELQAKADRLDAARAKVEPIVAAGHKPDVETTKEFIEAVNDMWKTFGRPPLFISKDQKPE